MSENHGSQRASLTEGLRQLHAIFAIVMNCEPAEGLETSEPLDPDFARLPEELPA